MLKFGTEFVHVTACTLEVLKVKGSKVKVTWLMPTDRQNIGTIWEIGVTESNGCVSILTESSEIAVYAYAQYGTNLAKNTDKRDHPSFLFLWGDCERRGWYDNSQPERRPHSNVAQCSYRHYVCEFQLISLWSKCCATLPEAGVYSVGGAL